MAAAVFTVALCVQSTHAIILDLGQVLGNPADQDSRLDRLNNQIDLYNADNDPDLAEAVMAGSFKTDSDAGTSIDIDITGWSYLVIKWASLDHYWYIGDDDGVVTFDSTVFNQNDQPQDISGYSLFNPGDGSTRVPESGATLGFLGLAVAALAVVSRRRKS